MNHIQIVGCHEFCQLVPHCCLHLRDGCPSQLSNSQENHAIFQYGFLQHIFRVPIRNRVHCEGVGQRSRFQSLPRFARSRSVCTTTLRELRVRVHCWIPVLEVEHGLVLRLSSRLMGGAAGSTLLEPPPLPAQLCNTSCFPMQKSLPSPNGPPNGLHYDPLAGTNLGCSWSPRPCGALGNAKGARSSARSPFLRASCNFLGPLPTLEPPLEPRSNELFQR